jgi:FKBP-type peptidyl-prolyl cis-trans isomerase FkpA
MSNVLKNKPLNLSVIFCYSFLSSLLLFIISCSTTPYEGYTATKSGLYYKLQMIGDGKKTPQIGDYLQLNITYKTANDSVFYDTYSSNETGMVILKFEKPSFKASFEEGLTKMNEGDSTSFIVSADSLFKKFFKMEVPIFFKKKDVVKMDVKLHRILTKNQYVEELNKYQKILEDRDIEELRKLAAYIDTCKTQYFSLPNGMHYIPIHQGVGDCVKFGDMVKIHYKGYFLNGRQFESTYDRAEPLEFNFGEEGQIIKGFKTALSLMNQGSKSKFIIPSSLAFGDLGSATNIVPPYTTVVYEIELISLIKNN